ncbi:hypothetical protein [Legionella bononiensis]|uniref:Dot/Icm T4SS effector n=1 Tax=Legionella bononiensis TaxID=2793102 RepID=A0ABS1WD25_9GAMM|nr:hypothetical protein [Legionella bononiensis]MBL7479133.1 hypothetical protein [Legionella bononiensis]MBL7527266.1 hypothetical protein [Legionella bononiensis]MBL7562235.1 hypothetical protein [Legionella bononiensis]
MTKIVFCFAGTGDPGEDYANSLEKTNSFKPDVIRVYMRGCQHDKVGGGLLFPDLEIVSNSIRNAFNKDDQTIDLDKLQELMGDGICRIEGPKYLSNHKITDIGLQGFSRGAVTTFAVAKKLDDLNIPMDIIANQPVPGQIAENSPGSLFSKYHDLSKCQNIRSATTFLASHNLENGVIHNSFFQQMAAKFSSTTQSNTYIMPHQAHLEWFRHWIIPVHINRQFTQAGFSEAKWADSASVLKDQYRQKDLYFTPKEFSQKVFGIDLATVSKDPVYLEMIQEKAKGLLQNTAVQLSDEQASAVVAISEVNDLSQEQKKQQMNLVAQDNEAGKTFTQIINKTHDVVRYLSHVTRDDPKNKSVKSKLIDAHSDAYKKEIYSKSFDYLSKPAPTDEDKKSFLVGINKADKEFEGKALNVDRGVMRKAMKIIANTILHVTGLFLIANTINLAVTGDWFFFNKTRSANVVNAASNEIKTLASSTQDTIMKNQDIKAQYQDTKNEDAQLDGTQEQKVKI